MIEPYDSDLTLPAKTNAKMKTKNAAKTCMEAPMYLPFQPLYYVTKLVGIMPLKLVKRNWEVFLMSDANDIYYFLWYLFLYITGSTYSMYCVITDDVNYVVVSQTMVVIESVTLILLLFVVKICSYVYRRLLISTARFVVEVDLLMKGIRISGNDRACLRTTRRLLVVMFVSVVIRAFLMISTIRVDFFQQAVLFLAVLMKSLSKYEFVALVQPISARFNKINNCILSYHKNKTSQTNLSEILYVLCRLHYKLCNITRIINTAFAFQLLFSIAVSLSDILFQSYYLYVALNDKNSLVTGWMLACPIAWLIDEIFEIYLLVYSCATTCDHANNTPIILHELRNNIQNFEIEKHIQMYSLQMLHQKIQFSALGFFAIDYTLIYSIAGAVTTYLVIFIQFDQNQKGAEVGNTTQLIDNLSTTPTHEKI